MSASETDVRAVSKPSSAEPIRLFSRCLLFLAEQCQICVTLVLRCQAGNSAVDKVRSRRKSGQGVSLGQGCVETSSKTRSSSCPAHGSLHLARTFFSVMEGSCSCRHESRCSSITTRADVTHVVLALKRDFERSTLACHDGDHHTTNITSVSVLYEHRPTQPSKYTQKEPSERTRRL